MATRPRHYDLIIDGKTVSTRSTLNRTYTHCVAVNYGTGWTIASACGNLSLAQSRLTEMAKRKGATQIEIFPLTLRGDTRPAATPAKMLAARKAVLTKALKNWTADAERAERRAAEATANREAWIEKTIGMQIFDVNLRQYRPRTRDEATAKIDEDIVSATKSATESRERAARIAAERAALG